MNWLTKILGRDDAQERIARAEVHREEAAQDLQESRELSSSLRAHDTRNHLTARMAAAFAANERHHRRQA
jgi:hypothetical protein